MTRKSALRRNAVATIALFAFALAGAGQSAALSEITPDNPVPAQAGESPAAPVSPDLTPGGAEVDRVPLGPVPQDDGIAPIPPIVPLPDPIPSLPDIGGPDVSPDVTGEDIRQRVMAPGETVPEPVLRFKTLIEDAARTGDIENLRPLLGSGAGATQLSFGGDVGDPVTYLKSLSGDGEGREILAIMLDVLAVRAAEMTGPDGAKLYVWPYFVARDLDQLSPPEQVDLFTVVTSADLEGMRDFGAYNFYRIGITEAGEWVFFVSGD